MPFKIAVPQDALDEVRAKVDVATLPPPAPSSEDSWQYGAPLDHIQRFVEYWKTSYEWKKHEALLNEELPQFTMPISVKDHGVIQAHFVHQKSQRSTAGKVIPLLFVHGWPGSFIEVRQILPLLTNPEGDEDPVFDVVAPSLPGFGFSGAPEKSGFAMDQYAEFCHNLMLELGYNEYVVQGGDWGFVVSQRIAFHYGPKHAKAWHTNFPAGHYPSLLKNPRAYIAHLLTPYTKDEKAGLLHSKEWQGKGNGYFEIQSTKPQTLAYSLADSPIGLLAWIYEKLVAWTDNYPWTEDEVLTWIHIYLFSHTQSTSSAATSIRIYYEVRKAGDLTVLTGSKWYNGKVPMGVSVFPRELLVVPSTWHRTLGWLVYTGKHTSGGHFAAHEKPDELVEDIRKMCKLPEVQKRL
ncbi:hypothetical protein PHLGIDRAFT_110977 [Phlebiopsis gigantea 11061_1 CR5-6]|uniref:Epoxide hydrolase N-terminal domain-containing protein n=1 Tax=Phlebiopsis gigantea (strain 11061_1 CR5-6) TaxID=745531 RepID=A0A0C3PDI7_PHLG1|nr:hypothetical protein PHLGIDRAFT_110977 [Phlebiopsis gigantea 11061_1 CR5-6]